MTYICNIDMINTSLKNLQYDFIVKLVEDTTDFIGVYAIDNSYDFKVPSSFIQKLEKIFNENGDIEEDLKSLFGHELPPYIDKTPSFFLHWKLGFATSDYAEFSVEYEPIELMKLTEAEFTIGEMTVKVSPCSSLFYLLIKQFDRGDVENIYDTNEPFDIYKLQTLGNHDNIRKFHSYTIKMKKISSDISRNSSESFESLQNDLYTALYYLSVLFPTHYNELPKIDNLLSDAESEDDKPYVNLDRDTSISTKSVPMPTHPTALRYFYHADQLVLQGFGQEAILYYYKVLEHFFDEAWKIRIEELVSQKADSHTIAEAVIRIQPRGEEAYLRLVVDFEPTHTLWTEVEKYKFSDKEAKSLAGQIYQTRNKFAHGKKGKEADIPHLFFDQTELNKKLAVFRATAKATLLKFGGISI
jgi:hypothetical protein